MENSLLDWTAGAAPASTPLPATGVQTYETKKIDPTIQRGIPALLRSGSIHAAPFTLIDPDCSLSIGVRHLNPGNWLGHLKNPASGRVAVLGCGVVGLATARILQQRGREVTIYAKALPPDTTSNSAGGLWLPYSLFDPDRETPEFHQQYLQSVRFS